MVFERLGDLEPPARLVDASIFVLVGVAVLTGTTSLLSGTPGGAWVFDLHAVAGLTLVVLLFWKFRRVLPRVRSPERWDTGTPISLLLAGLALAALATGITWAFAGTVSVGSFTLLTIHMVIGVLVVPALLWHLRHRLRLPRSRDVEGRRTALQYTGMVAIGAITWRLQDVVGSLAGLAGADRRFTGSSDAGGEGNDFPVVSWVADDPNPIDPETWSLTVDGEVEERTDFSAGDLSPGDGSTVDGRASDRAVLDCTGGWYAARDWEGVRLADLLATVGTTDAARWVRIESVTGYRWSFPLEEAGDLLLATHVDGEPLTHGHGAPLRLVAPGRRGFQWVKWIVRIDVTRRQDLSQWIAIFVSGFDDSNR